MQIDMRKRKPRRLGEDQLWVTCDDLTDAKAVVTGASSPTRAAEEAAEDFGMYRDGTVLVEDPCGRTYRIRVSIHFNPKYSGRAEK